MTIFVGYICFRLLMLVTANIPGKRNGVAKVAGSNPVTPTNTKTVACVYRSGRFFMVRQAWRAAPLRRYPVNRGGWRDDLGVRVPYGP